MSVTFYESLIIQLSKKSTRRRLLTKLRSDILEKLVSDIQLELSGRKVANEELKNKALELGISLRQLKQRKGSRQAARRVRYLVDSQIVEWSGRGHAPLLLQSIIEVEGKAGLLRYIYQD